MLRAAVCVSGGGTNLQAIIDAAAAGTITNTGFHRKSLFQKITKTGMLLEKH